MEKPNQQSVNLDSILENLGALGKYNVINISLVLLPIFLSGFYEVVYIFEAPVQEFRCRIPECEGIATPSQWLPFTTPNYTKENLCKRFAPLNLSENFANNLNGNYCQKDKFDNNQLIECSEVVYTGDYSSAKDFNLGCEEWKRTLVGTVHSSGLIVALLLAGTISDRYGRRIALGLSFLANFIFGFGRSFATDYKTYLAMHFLESAFGGGAYSSSFVYAIELVAPRQRVVSNSLFNISFVFGVVSLAGIAYWLENWRTMLQVIYAPALLVAIYVGFMNESARWLLSKGRRTQAIEVLTKAAKMNNIKLEKLELEQLSTPIDKIKEVEDDSEFKKAVKSLIIWKRILASSFLWVTCTFVYYGMSINSVSLAGNKYLNFIMVIVVEIPASLFVIVVLKKYGRKKTIMVNFLMSGVLCLGFAFTPTELSALSLTLYLMGKFCISLTYSSVYIFTSEVFPTSLRQTLIGVCSTTGRIGSMLAPMTPLLQIYNKSLPMFLFGLMCLCSAFLVLLLPETNNTRLPDTIEEAEAMTPSKIDSDDS